MTIIIAISYYGVMIHYTITLYILRGVIFMTIDHNLTEKQHNISTKLQKYTEENRIK